jgi:hypothetical protein
MFNDVEIEKIVTTKPENRRLCIITSKLYSSSMDYLNHLIGIAQKDFILTDSEISVKCYSGRFRKGMFGIEFEITTDEMPTEYKELSDDTICDMFPTY